MLGADIMLAVSIAFSLLRQVISHVSRHLWGQKGIPWACDSTSRVTESLSTQRHPEDCIVLAAISRFAGVS